MTIRFDCEFCGKTLKADDSKGGKKVKCPGCEALLTIPAPPSESEVYDAEETSQDDGEDWDESADSGTVACPACGEEKPANKSKCPFCGEVGSKKKKKSGGRRRSDALARVQGPAIGLIVCAVIGGLVQALAVIFQLSMGEGEPAQIVGAVVQGAIVAITTPLIIVGALKMKSLKSHGMSITACILAMVPCFSPCCLLGLPIGIWAIVVLNDSAVKSEFD